MASSPAAGTFEMPSDRVIGVDGWVPGLTVALGWTIAFPPASGFPIPAIMSATPMTAAIRIPIPIAEFFMVFPPVSLSWSFAARPFVVCRSGARPRETLASYREFFYIYLSLTAKIITPIHRGKQVCGRIAGRYIPAHRHLRVRAVRVSGLED